MEASAKISTDDVSRFIRDGYHEILHGIPELKAQFNQSTGAITYLSETLPVTADSIPDGMDTYVPHLTHFVKWRILTFSRMDQAQAARAKLENDAFQEIFKSNPTGR